MFTPALFTAAKIGEQPKGLLKDEWIKKMWCYIAQSCLILCDPRDCGLPGSPVHGDSPGQNTGVRCHALLQGTFPVQGLNPSPLSCRQILYHLTHQGSPQ